MTQTGSTQTTALVAGYFNQGTHYYSGSKGAMIPIAEMEPTHAANAAEKLLAEALHWANEAGQLTGRRRRPYTWAASTSLVRALWTRSQAASPDASGTGIPPNAYRCAGCAFATASVERMSAHGAATGHCAG